MSSNSTDEMLKMFFSLETESGNETESMWVKPLGGAEYEISNIPFYAKGIAYGDVVLGEREDDGGLGFIRVLRSGDHSTVRVVVFSEPRVQDVCARFEALGCQLEIADIKTLIAIDVPPSTPWQPVAATLEALAADGLIDWEEAALSRHHVP